MKKQLFLGALAMASLSFTACSSDNEIDEIVTPEVNDNEQIIPTTSYQALANFEIETKLGSSANSATQSRTLGDVDESFRPGTKYYLDRIFMLALNPEEQPTRQDIGKNVVVDYSKEKSTMKRHQLHNGSYKLYYRLGDDVSEPNEQYSRSGSIYLSPTLNGDDEEIFQLSVFELADLQNSKENHIKLNKFAFDSGVSPVRGTTLRYTSYDPANVNDNLSAPAVDPSETYLSGQFVSLPKVEGLDFLSKDTDLDLVSECKDQYFSGSEFLIAADAEKIYLLKVVPVTNDHGGYFEVRSYPTPKGTAYPEQLELNRLTTIANASFMITSDDAQTATYYAKGNPAQSVKNFKRNHGIDLSTMTCPYAILDGINSRFFINEYKEADNTENPSRLVLWAEDQPVVGVDGQEYDKLPSLSNDVYYSTSSGAEFVTRGFGMKGQSYSVVFQGIQNDLSDQMIAFYVNVEGVNVRLKAYMPHLGFALNKNVARTFVVYVPETKFANIVNENKARSASRASNEYVDLELPAGSVVVR